MNRRQATLGLAVLASGVVCTKLKATDRPSPQVLRRSRNLAGEVANLKDYCSANGSATDTQRYQELIDLQPASIVYPADTRLVLDKAISLRGGQEHNFADGARIDAETRGYALAGTGATTQHLMDLAAPVERYARRVILAGTPDIMSGDFMLLADISAAPELKIEANVVESVDANVVTTRYPIGRGFADHRAVRLYKVYDPVRNLRFSGRIRIVNHDRAGGVLRLTNASGVQLSDLIIENAGYLGISLESSLGAQVRNIVVQGAGASGLGLRASKAIEIDGFSAKGVRVDESLTFYDNVSHASAKNISIEQYTYEDNPPGYSSGNNILIDLFCSNISLEKVKCAGSATYNVMINNQCDNCSLKDFVLERSNLGGIRVSRRCNNTQIASGRISEVISAYDQEGRKAVSAISVGSTCMGTTIEGVAYGRIATGRQVAALRDVE